MGKCSAVSERKPCPQDLHSQLRNTAGQQVASLTGVYIFRGGDNSFLQLCCCACAPEALRSLAPSLFNEFGRPLDVLKQHCGVRARTAGFLWLSSLQAPNLESAVKKEFTQKVFTCLGGAMKRLSLVVCPFQEDLAEFGFQFASVAGTQLCLWEKHLGCMLASAYVVYSSEFMMLSNRPFQRSRDGMPNAAPDSVPSVSSLSTPAAESADMENAAPPEVQAEITARPGA